MSAKTLEELRPMLFPEGVHNGIVTIDKNKCLNCGLCIKNCPFKCLENGEDGYPTMKSDYTCFSCFNCKVPCSRDAIKIEQSFHVIDGFYDTEFPPILEPLAPKDADGNLTQWNETENLIMNRRSVRNFKKDSVSDHLLRRVVEAGRFAPSSGNHQPWKFIVVTDPVLLNELEETCYAVWKGIADSCSTLYGLVALANTLPVGIFDPRVLGGLKSVAERELPIFFHAPAVIIMAGNEKMTYPEINMGICGENMNLAATSLGLGCCWSSFGSGINYSPELKAKLGLDENWVVHSNLCLGYPQFKQSGLVPRHKRPVTWFRNGATEAAIE